ncbi:methylated-DNA--[protein]-cysteine S-methyltransferase [Methanofollis aquaemaris]|uniref:Methylated-DNA--[protein]-cysteine S-methyltransferase n=1 Tax=Methanofollis aquaemaris TaxID=126734 RepID=A0A8A3S7Z7_9EURY|nr:methylated-DNA--[protein]-cysteine S-methyltransferase [Methanofollis aquaemaris]QSZ68053.1 methylated-DNA--[protein]-cysteine S-methyltransferase [Methanofollis aquaemaris]
MHEGSCSFGLWHVHVAWEDDFVSQVCFLRHPAAGGVPEQFTRYLAGDPAGLADLRSVATEGESVFARIYRAVQAVPYGETTTYGEVAARVGTVPRVVGTAMRLNPTPLVVPCHRVVAKDGPGGFSPSIELKQALLSLERGKRIY